MRRIFSLLLLSSTLFGDWSSYVDLTARSNGYRRGVGLHGFVPLKQSESSLWFGQALAGRYWDVWSGALGGGYRRFFGERFAGGVNLFLDGAYTDHSELYGQVGIGGEFIGPCWAVRANGYLPFTNRRIASRLRDVSLIPSGNQLLCQFDDLVLREYLYRGFDLEASYGMDVWCGTVWGTLGYFYYNASGPQDVQGPRVRLEYRLDDFLGWCGAVATVGGEYEYNRVNKNYGSAVVALRIPIGCPGRAMSCCSQGSLLRQMGDRVRRNEAIFIRALESCASRPGEILNGIQFFVAAPRGIVSAAGTLEDPTTLDEAARRAGPGDILFVLAGDHSLPLDETLGLAQGQSLLGSGQTHTTPYGRLITPVTIHRPTVEWRGNATPMTQLISGGTKIAGIEFDGSGASAIIAGQNVVNVILERNSFRGAGRGIELKGATQPTVDRNHFVSLDEGLVIEGLVGSGLVRSNRFDGVANGAVHVRHTGGIAELEVRENRSANSGGFSFAASDGELKLGIFHNKLSDVIGDGVVVERVGRGAGRLELRAMHNQFKKVQGTALHLAVQDQPRGQDEDEPAFAFDVWSNRVEESGGAGVRVANFGSGSGMEGRVRENTLIRTGVVGGDGAVSVDGDMGKQGRLVVDVARNRVDGASGAAASAFGHVGSLGAMHVTITGNKDVNSASTSPAYAVESAWRYQGVLHFDMQNNESSRKVGALRVVQDGGTVLSKSAAFAISGANNNLDLQQEGTFGIADKSPDQPSWPEESK